MAEYSQVFIDYCREVMPIETFRIFMEFLGAEDADVYCSLLKGRSIVKDPPASKLKGGQPAGKNEKNKY